MADLIGACEPLLVNVIGRVLRFDHDEPSKLQYHEFLEQALWAEVSQIRLELKFRIQVMGQQYFIVLYEQLVRRITLQRANACMLSLMSKICQDSDCSSESGNKILVHQISFAGRDFPSLALTNLRHCTAFLNQSHLYFTSHRVPIEFLPALRLSSFNYACAFVSEACSVRCSPVYYCQLWPYTTTSSTQSLLEQSILLALLKEAHLINRLTIHLIIRTLYFV